VNPLRNASAAVALVVGLCAVVGVPAAIAAALPDDEPMPPGERLDVGLGVSMLPPPDARLDLDEARPGSGLVAFRSGPVTVTVTAVYVRDRPGEFVAHTRHKFSRDEDLTPGPAAPWRLAAGGVVGERGDLRAADGSFTVDELGNRPGCYALAVVEQLAAVVTMTPVAGCAAVPPEIWTAAGSLTFEPEEGL
jgi:hypothetical protein